MFSEISKKAGHGGRIEAAEFKTTQGEFDNMLSDQKEHLDNADNPERTPYRLKGEGAHNCGTVAADIIKDNVEDSGMPSTTNPRPVKMIQESLGSSKATRVGYDPSTNTTTRRGNYIKSESERKTDERLNNGN